MVANLLRRGYLLGLGFLDLTREKAEQLVEEMINHGEVRREEAQTFVQELLKRGQVQREEISKTVRSELQVIIKQAGVATKTELASLEERLAALETKISD